MKSVKGNKSKKTKKIMFVTPYFYPKIGGLENYAYNIALGLKNKYKWEVVIVTSNHENPKEYKEENIKGMKIYRLPRLLKISNTPINPMWYFQIKKIIKKEQPSIINGHAPVPFIADVAARAAKSMKIPFILTYHAGSMKKDNLLYDIMINLYEKMILGKTKRLSKNIICSSDFVKEQFIKNKSSITVNPGVKVNNNSYKHGKNIIYVGKIDKSSHWKGIKYLIESLSLIKDKIKGIEIRFVGDGDCIEHYKRLSNKLNLKISFSGEKTGKSLDEEYFNSSILVLPSVSEAESFGMVLIEAMAHKKPVIGSNIGGIPYVIDHNKNGLLVPPKNPEKLAEAIAYIIKNPKIARKMGEEGYKKVKNSFTWEIQVNKTDKLLGGISK